MGISNTKNSRLVARLPTRGEVASSIQDLKRRDSSAASRRELFVPGTLKSDEPNLMVGSYWPYATTVWDYINRAMPYQKPGSLSAKQVYSLTAYLLFMNKIIDEREVLNQNTLLKVRMPNRDAKRLCQCSRTPVPRRINDLSHLG